MDDSISRRAAIDATECIVEHHAITPYKTMAAAMDHLKRILNGMQSAEPDVLDTNDGDMISKRAVLDILYLDPGIDEIREEMIKNLPSAESERQTGRWIKRTRIYESGTCTSYDPEWFCSECRTKYDPYFAFNRVKFCYVCGADMRGEKE